MHCRTRRLINGKWYLSNQLVDPSKFLHQASVSLGSAWHPHPSFPLFSSPWSQGGGTGVVMDTVGLFPSWCLGDGQQRAGLCPCHFMGAPYLGPPEALLRCL